MPVFGWKFNPQIFQVHETTNVTRNHCHKLARVSSGINMLQKGLKEQTYKITGTHPALSAVIPTGRAACVAMTQASWPEHSAKSTGTTLIEQRCGE